MNEVEKFLIFPFYKHRAQFFSVFVQGLIITYSDLWAEFSVMEDKAKPSATLSTNPHLAVADLELDLHTRRSRWASDPQVGGPQENWNKNTWCGVLLSSSSHDVLFRLGPPPLGTYVAFYARPENRAELKMTLYTSFEEAAYEVYQRNLLLFHLALQENPDVPDTTNLPEISGGGAGEGEEMSTSIEQEDKRVLEEYSAGEHESQQIVYDASDPWSNGLEEKENKSDGEEEQYNVELSPTGSIASKQFDESIPDSPTKSQQSDSPLSRRRRNTGKLLLMNAHGTSLLSKQVLQTIYFVVGSALHNTFELNLWIGRHLDSVVLDEQERKMRQYLTYINGSKGALADAMPCYLVEMGQRVNLIFAKNPLFNCGYIIV